MYNTWYTSAGELCATDDALPQEPGHAPSPVCLPITSISHCVERFSLTAVIICSCHLLSRYSPTWGLLWGPKESIKASDGSHTCTYNYRLPPTVYNEALTGHVRAIARCSFHLQDSHSDTYCPISHELLPQIGYVTNTHRLASPTIFAKSPPRGSSAKSQKSAGTLVTAGARWPNASTCTSMHTHDAGHHSLFKTP